MNTKIRAALSILGTVAASLITLPASAQEDAASFPSKDITIIVPYNPGGTATAFANLQAEYLEKVLGQTLRIENVPGGGGAVAAEHTARADADGYTWMSISSGMFAVNPHFTGFDPYEELTLVATSRAQPFLFLVRSDSKYKTFGDLVADAKSRPGEVAYSSLGVGSTHHIIALMAEEAAGMEMLHIPYTGSQQYMTDLLAGRIDLAMSTPSTAARFKEEVRALALAQPFASTLAPDVPTSDKAGIGGVSMPSWVGVAVPKGTPDAIIQKIDEALAKVHEMPEYQAKVLKLKTEPFYVSGKEYYPELDKLRGRITQIIERLDLDSKK